MAVCPHIYAYYLNMTLKESILTILIHLCKHCKLIQFNKFNVCKYICILACKNE